jgi:hypothetical protein
MQTERYYFCDSPRKHGKMPVRSQEVCSHGLADLSFDSTSPGRGVIKPAKTIIL